MANWSGVKIDKESSGNGDGARIISHTQIEETDPMVYINRAKVFANLGKYRECGMELVKALSFAKNDIEKQYAEEYLSYYELFFNTRKSIKELFFTMWDTGIWLIFYGFFIFLGFMGIADCILLAPFTTSGIIMFENMIILFFNMIHAAAKLNINTENKNDKTLDRAWGIAKKELLKMGIKLSMILLAILIPLVIIVRDSVAAVEIMWGISVILGIIQLLRLIIKMVIAFFK